MICPICSSTRTKLIWRNIRFHIYECRECSQVFTFPRERVDFYNENYYAAYARKEEADVRVFDAILAWLEGLRAPGRLLDVGCGIGTFIARAHQRGWKVVGIDTSEAAIRAARAKYPQVDLVCGDVTKIADQTYDVVTLFDMLMYVPEPIPFLARVRERLNPRGLLIVKAVNRPAAFIRALNWGLCPMRLRGQSLLFLPNALYHFSSNMLARLIEPQGYRVIATLPIAMPGATGAESVRERIVQLYGRILTRILLKTSHFVNVFERVE